MNLVHSYPLHGPSYVTDRGCIAMHFFLGHTEYACVMNTFRDRNYKRFAVINSKMTTNWGIGYTTMDIVQ